MKTTATSPSATRHRLLEGVLLRLARLPDAGGLALRGGVLLRHWFRPTPRPTFDLDLVAPAPLTVEDARRWLPLFADDIEDGVTFDPDRLHFDAIWQSTANPGIRIFAHGAVGDREAEVKIDITGGPPPVPAAVLGELPTACGRPARVWMCRPEAVAGQKLQALWHLGLHLWRPKDLDDLRLLLERLPMDPALLREAVAALFADLGGTGDDARALFAGSSWWGMKYASACWLDYVATRGRHAPRDLAAAVAEVSGRLAPILEGLP
jgi:hypothetical protein